MLLGCLSCKHFEKHIDLLSCNVGFELALYIFDLHEWDECFKSVVLKLNQNNNSNSKLPLIFQVNYITFFTVRYKMGGGCRHIERMLSLAHHCEVVFTWMIDLCWAYCNLHRVAPSVWAPLSFIEMAMAPVSAC